MRADRGGEPTRVASLRMSTPAAPTPIPTPTGDPVIRFEQARQGALVAEPAAIFMPLQVASDLSAPIAPTDTSSAVPATPYSATIGRIEIALPDGTVIRVDETIGAAALRRVVTVLRG